MNAQDLRELLEKTEDKLSVFVSEEILSKYAFNATEFCELIRDFLTNEERIKLLHIQKASPQKLLILNTLDSNCKIDVMLEERSFHKYDIIQILISLDVKTLIEFLVQHNKFCSEHDIQPYEIIYRLPIEKIKDFVANLECIDIPLNEKRKILARLMAGDKRQIDTTNLPKEYKTALSIKTRASTGQIILDLERDLEDYRGLDDLMSINPEKFTEEQRNKFMQLCDICPNLQIVSDIYDIKTTTSEYKEAEAWIDAILNNLAHDYSSAQKIAVIDNAIGRKISYSPDFNTEVFDKEASRTLWKVISSGYGVCNGIAKVEQYILDRIGIESEIVSSGIHAFLKLKDIDLPLASGETTKGNTILDPTWNLTMHRFGAIPNNFCMSYEEARKRDIDIEGIDHNCHKNDEELQDATLNLNEQSLRKLFTSVGLADKEGQFPIKDLIEKSKSLDEIYAGNPAQNIVNQFLLLSKVCPEFATCQNSSMSILSNILLSNKNLQFNKCVVNRVYDRTDKAKMPTLFVYIDSNELGQKFYFANKAEGQFVELQQEEFIKQFECYEEDLKKYNRTQTMGNQRTRKRRYRFIRKI